MLTQGRPQFYSSGNGAFSRFRGIGTQAGTSCSWAETPGPSSDSVRRYPMPLPGIGWVHREPGDLSVRPSGLDILNHCSLRCVIAQIATALEAAHKQGVVHRDLKPGNILLDEKDRPCVVDFGLARRLHDSTLTRPGAAPGTPAYMSPEQARNARDVDQRADLWSAGVLLYEMLTGRPAFPASNEYARLAALLSTEPEPVQNIDPSLAPLAGFFERALKKDRN